MSSSPAEKPEAPVSELCKMGCGFFGNDATSGCCSKCFLTTIKKAAAPAPVSILKKGRAEPSTTSTSSSSFSLEQMEVANKQIAQEVEPPASPKAEEPTTSTAEPSATLAEDAKPTATTANKKKKKKKASYKNLMSSMMKESSKDANTQREALRQGLGGGAFSKIDKI